MHDSSGAMPALRPIREINRSFLHFLGKEVAIRGRVVSVRRMRQSVFTDLVERAARIQLRFATNTQDTPASGDLIEVAGLCVYSEKGEPTVDVILSKVIAKWHAGTGFRRIAASKQGPLHSFLPHSYERLYYAQAVRNHARQFLVSHGFLEVQTPVLCTNYNGGRSFPVVSSYLGHRIGYNRATMEDRMQALIGIGFEKVFQIGSIFRSESEHTLLEGYAAYMGWEEGKQLLKDFLGFVVQGLIDENIGDRGSNISNVLEKKWNELEFIDAAALTFGIDHECLVGGGPELLILLHKKGIIKSADMSLESAADELADALAQREGSPTIVSGFPLWSSPLYKVCSGPGYGLMLQRSRMYLPPQKGGFELGVQENDYTAFLQRIRQQREMWELRSNDDRVRESDLAIVISGGLPPMFGFALNPDRIIRIWRNDCAIDPYKD